MPKRKAFAVSCAIISSFFLASSITSSTASALNINDTIDNNSQHCSTYALNQLDEPITFSTITIDSEENPLYCTFSDRGAALEKLKTLIPKLLDLAAEKGQLTELTSNNWKEYRQYISIATTDEAIYGQYIDDIIIANAFFDIYENDDSNAEIINYLNSDGKMRSNLEKQFDLGLMLPNYAPLVEREQKKMTNNILARASINTTSAISYAMDHAYLPNKDTYGYLEGVDCTNFVSQILIAGGVQQEVYSSKYQGWWHKKSLFGHEYSRSWTLSDTFARYMGVGFTTTDHGSFSLNIAKGDFIGLDEDNDGEWNHMAFVVDHKPLVQLVDGQYGKYSDYMVAQHSPNYMLWTSNANNGWSRQPGAKYARIRR